MFRNFFKSKRTIFGVEVADWLLVALALAIFTTITLWTITKSSIWFDEAFGVYLIRFNFLDISRYTATDVHPPVFYWLLKLWSMLFGTNELALRSMSTFFGGIAIVFGYLLTNKLFNKTAARVSLIFMALSPMLVRYGQEARMYTLVAAIALAATYVLTFAINSKKKLPWVIYGILISLGMWVHYFSAIVWIAHWIWRSDIVRRTAKKGEFVKKFFSKEWKLAHYIAIGLYLPWLPFFIGQSFVVQVGGFWIPPVSPGTPLNFLTNVIYYRDLGDTTGLLALAIVAVGILLVALAFRVYKSMSKLEKQSYRLIMILAFVPVLFLFFLSMIIRPVFIDRYFIASTLGIAMFIGITLAYGYKFLRPKWGLFVGLLIIVMMGFGVANVYRLGNYNKNSSDSNQTRQIVQAAIAKAGDKQPIIAVTPWIYMEEVFYQTNNHPVYFLNVTDYKYGSLDMVKYNDYHKISDIKSFAKNNPVIWYVGWIGGGELKAPDSNWKQLQKITINDQITGKPEYEAIQFKINN